MNTPVEIAVPPLLGRAGVFQQRKTFQLFSEIASGGVVNQPDRNVLPFGWMRDYVPQTPGECGDGLAPRKQKCERLFRITTSAHVAYRDGGPFVPLTKNQFADLGNSQAPDPAGAVTGGSGYFRVLCTLTSVRGDFDFYMDVGQTLEVYALQLNLSISGPPNTIEVTQQNDANSDSPAILRGLVVDARIGAVLEPIEVPTGLNRVQYTQMIEVPAGTQQQIEIPAYAESVRIYQDSRGASSSPWQRYIGPPTTFNDGSITFAGRTSRPRDERIGRESTLLTDVNLISDRGFTLIWTIKP